jgi:hypothetical protein
MVGVYFKLQMKPTSTVLPRARSAIDLLKFECNNGCVAKKILAPGCVDPCMHGNEESSRKWVLYNEE